MGVISAIAVLVVSMGRFVGPIGLATCLSRLIAIFRYQAVLCELLLSHWQPLFVIILRIGPESQCERLPM